MTSPMTGLSLGPEPLTRATMLELPPATKFGSQVVQLETALQRDFLRALAGRLEKANSSRRTELFKSVSRDMDALVRGVRRWLSADFERATQRLFRTIPIELDPRRRKAEDRRRAVAARSLVDGVRLLTELEDLLGEGPGLAELLRGTIFFPWARPVDEFERRMSPRIAELAFMSVRLTEETAQDLVAWLQLTRLAAAVAIVRGIPFERVWGPVAGLPGKTEFRDGLYGTVGYELAERVIELAAGVAEHQLFESMRERAPHYRWMVPYVTFSGDPTGAQYPIGRQLDAVPTRSTEWRYHCVREGCTPREKGMVWPAEFEPLTEDEHGDATFRGRTPDHMYARPSATRRVLEVRSHWQHVHRQLQLPDHTLKFRINAASLRYGGAHPPHRSHRNGAMFDLDLTVPERGAIDPVCEITVTEPVIGVEAVHPLIEQVQRLVALIFPRMEPVETEDPATVRTTCLTDYTYDPARRVAGLAPELIARRFTQCMLLTMPSEVLFASWGVLRDSWNGLYAAVNANGSDASLGEEGRAALTQLRRYFDTPAPLDSPEKRSFRTLFPRHDHDDHWHVSYDPDDIDADAYARAKTLQWIASNRDRFLPDPTTDGP